MLHENLLREFIALSQVVGEQLAAPILALFEDEDPIPPSAEIADLTECAYTGYARSSAVVFGTSHLTASGSVITQITPKEFAATGSAVPGTARQVAMLNAAGTEILASYVLEEPLSFVDANSVYMVGFPLTLPQDDGTLEEVNP